jgi:hypothetical protein
VSGFGYNINGFGAVGGGAGGPRWHILMAATGIKTTTRTEAHFANPGTSSFLSATKSSTGAGSRTAIGDGEGVYKAFFDCTNVTKFAYINGNGNLTTPSSNSIYAVYEPNYNNSRNTSGNESIYDILKRIGTAMNANNYLGVSNHGNTGGDSQVLAVSPGITEMVTGYNGYSAVRTSASSGNIGGTGISGHADSFCVIGENQDSDHDTQVLCFFDGNLSSGKGDNWRSTTPAQTSWSYWGNDFHTNSASQNIASARQTAVGANTYTGILYILVYGEM